MTVSCKGFAVSRRYKRITVTIEVEEEESASKVISTGVRRESSRLQRLLDWLNENASTVTWVLQLVWRAVEQNLREVMLIRSQVTSAIQQG